MDSMKALLGKNFPDLRRYHMEVAPVLVLPLILTNLSTAEISLWYLFSTIISLQILINIEFSPTFARIISYGLGGATQIKDFHLFDTSYFFMSSPTSRIKELFDISKGNVTLSTGKTAYFAFKKCGWLDYHAEFMELKKNNLLVQTDILCVKTPYFDILHRSLL
jgi:hypothetical protein